MRILMLGNSFISKMCIRDRGHHFSDVIETTLLGLFYGAQLQTMPPKLHSKNFPGMELIRPLYCVHEDAIIAWKNYNHLRFLQCACRFTEARDASGDGVGESKRQEMKVLLRELRKTNPNVEKSIFRAVHGVQLDTFPGFKYRGQELSLIHIFSNNRSGRRVTEFCSQLGIPYQGHAGKPSPRGLEAAMARAGVDRTHTAMLGDKLLTDVLAAHRAGVLSLMVEPAGGAVTFWQKVLHALQAPFKAVCRRRLAENG